MNRVIKRWFGVIRTVASVGVFVIGLAASTPAPALSQTYTLTDLGTLDSGPFTEAFGLNADAQIVGTSALKATIPSTGCPPRHQCVTLCPAKSLYAHKMNDLAQARVRLFR